MGIGADHHVFGAAGRRDAASHEATLVKSGREFDLLIYTCLFREFHMSARIPACVRATATDGLMLREQTERKE